MLILSEHAITCPYCGEVVTVLIDGSSPRHDYIEDCEVCCRPMVLEVSVGPGCSVAVTARTDSA